MIDQKFTEQIAKWLQSDHESTEKIQEGAMLLLQLNRAFRDHFMPEKDLRRLQVSSEPEALLRMLDAYEEG